MIYYPIVAYNSYLPDNSELVIHNFAERDYSSKTDVSARSGNPETQAEQALEPLEFDSRDEKPILSPQATD